VSERTSALVDRGGLRGGEQPPRAGQKMQRRVGSCRQHEQWRHRFATVQQCEQPAAAPCGGEPLLLGAIEDKLVGEALSGECGMEAECAGVRRVSRPGARGELEQRMPRTGQEALEAQRAHGRRREQRLEQAVGFQGSEPVGAIEHRARGSRRPAFVGAVYTAGDPPVDPDETERRGEQLLRVRPRFAQCGRERRANKGVFGDELCPRSAAREACPRRPIRRGPERAGQPQRRLRRGRRGQRILCGNCH
jgi:hypothetical protein